MPTMTTGVAPDPTWHQQGGSSTSSYQQHQHSGSWQTFLADSWAVWSSDAQQIYRQIDWAKDFWWLACVGTFFFQYLAILLLFRYEAHALFCMFFVNAALSSLGLPWLNSWLSQNWRELGLGRDYFDEDGFFVTLICGGPLVLLNLVILIKIVARTASLMIRVKRRQLLHAAAGAGGGGENQGGAGDQEGHANGGGVATTNGTGRRPKEE